MDINVSESTPMRLLIFGYLDGVGDELDLQHAFNSFSDPVRVSITKAS